MDRLEGPPGSDADETKNAAEGFQKDHRPPPFPTQAWNLAQAIGEFVGDGFRTVSPEQYAERLAICNGCEQRSGNRCLQCGCNLTLKARGRVFQCPLAKWPQT